MRVTFTNGIDDITVENPGEKMFDVQVTGTDPVTVANVFKALNVMTFLRKPTPGLPKELEYVDSNGLRHINTASNYFMENRLEGLMTIYGYHKK